MTIRKERKKLFVVLMLLGNALASCVHATHPSAEYRAYSIDTCVLALEEGESTSDE